MTAWDEKSTSLAAEFVHLVATTNPFHDHLFKIFKRKIKRRKSKLVRVQLHDFIPLILRQDDDALDEDSSEYDSDDGSEDKEDEDIDDSCPPGCDTTLYEQVNIYESKSKSWMR